MSQLLLFFGLQLLGSSACLAVGPRSELLCLALGFLIGLALAVFLGLPLLLLGVFTAASVIAVLGISLVAFVGLAVHRNRITKTTMLRLFAWAVGFTALCVPFCAWNVSKLTYDSQVFIDYAVALQDMHQLTLETLSYLHSWGLFQIVAHALAVVTREDHLYALAPAFSISLFATFVVALDRGLLQLGASSRHRTLAIALAVAALLGVPLLRLHIVYIHANWAAAGYLFVFGALFWLAEVTTDLGHLPPAFLGLLAFSFARVESPMFVAAFLVVMLSQTQLPRRALLVSYAPFTLVLTSWLLLMAAVVPDDSQYLTPAKSLLMALAIAAICVGYLLRDVAQRVLPVLPLVALGLCVGGVAAVAIRKPGVFLASFPSWQHDLWLGSFWGYFWWPTVAILAVLSIRVSPPASSRPLRYGIALFFVLVALLTALGDEYGSGRYGSLTRITLQIVPLIAFYFALVFTPRANPS